MARRRAMARPRAAGPPAGRVLANVPPPLFAAPPLSARRFRPAPMKAGALHEEGAAERSTSSCAATRSPAQDSGPAELDGGPGGSEKRCITTRLRSGGRQVHSYEGSYSGNGIPRCRCCRAVGEISVERLKRLDDKTQWTQSVHRSL
eukprot:scaffold21487_cov63-Phaeocystis_antarctica.AAC.2